MLVCLAGCTLNCALTSRHIMPPKAATQVERPCTPGEQLTSRIARLVTRSSHAHRPRFHSAPRPTTCVTRLPPDLQLQLRTLFPMADGAYDGVPDIRYGTARRGEDEAGR